MLPIKFIRENLDLVREAVRKKGSKIDLDHLIEVDNRRLALTAKVQDLRTQRNQLSNAVKLVPKGPNQAEERNTLIAESRKVGEELKVLEPELNAVDAELNDLLLWVPNIPAPEVPEGKTEEDNVEVAHWGTPRTFNFPIKDHVQLAEELDLVDLDRGAKVAGFRGYFLKNEAVLMEWAVLQLALNHVMKKGFTAMTAPSMVREMALIGSGHFPTGREETYTLERDDMYLVGTAEPPVTAYHANEILSEEQLPIRFAGYSPCFRREVGSYGKDVRGIMRVHQFNKVEQVVLCKNDPDESIYWHEHLRQNAEEILQMLGLPYRVVLVCAGEMGEPHVKKYDIETWVPSQNAYRETHSDSIFHDFQARRLNMRYRTKDGRIQFVHTLNNTAIATPRILIPLWENYQQEDGSILIPEALRSYMGGLERITPKAK